MSLVLSKSTGMVLVGGFQNQRTLICKIYVINLQLSSMAKHHRKKCMLVQRPTVNVSGGMTPLFVQSLILSTNTVHLLW